MHPITVETPFTRLWPHSPRRPQRPLTFVSQPPPPPAMAGHDFLVCNLRPDLVAVDHGSTRGSATSPRHG
jgi:hypothetical protein